MHTLRVADVPWQVIIHNHLLAGTGVVEAARISAIEYAGMTFQPDSWAIICNEGSGDELVYLGSMLQVSPPDSSTHIEYVQVFRFSFKQLKCTKEANRLRVSMARFQAVLDAAPSHVDRSFTPVACYTLRGRWIWTAKVFSDWVRSGSGCRSIHHSSVSETELLFTFR